MNSTDDENTGCWGYKMPPEEKRKLVGPQYIATKVVNARLMTLGEFNEIHPGQMFKGKTPEDEGYQVTYPQIGTEEPYQGWCPKAQFEAQNQDPRNGMSFGHAIEFIKRGQKVKRVGGTKTFALGTYSIRDIHDGIIEISDTLLVTHKPDESTACVDHKQLTPRSDQEAWVNLVDILATDWVVVD